MNTKIDLSPRKRRTKTHTYRYRCEYYSEEGYKAIMDNLVKNAKKHYSLKNLDEYAWNEARKSSRLPWLVEQKDYTTTLDDCAKKFIGMFKNRKRFETPWIRISLEDFCECEYAVKENQYEICHDRTMDLTKINDYISDGWFIHTIRCHFQEGYDTGDQWVNGGHVFDIVLHKMDGVSGEKVSDDTMNLLSEISNIAK